MTEIDRLSGMMEVLRRQIAESARRLDGKSGKPARASTSAASGKTALPEVKRQIRERIKALPKDDPERLKKAQRLFIESILAWEFGDALLMDSRFQDMLDRVQQGLAALPDAEKQFGALLSNLDGK
jgi:hypothetical protein